MHDVFTHAGGCAQIMRMLAAMMEPDRGTDHSRHSMWFPGSPVLSVYFWYKICLCLYFYRINITIPLCVLNPKWAMNELLSK